jgi:hypothetical protein
MTTIKCCDFRYHIYGNNVYDNLEYIIIAMKFYNQCSLSGVVGDQQRGYAVRLFQLNLFCLVHLYLGTLLLITPRGQ